MFQPALIHMFWYKKPEIIRLVYRNPPEPEKFYLSQHYLVLRI